MRYSTIPLNKILKAGGFTKCTGEWRRVRAGYPDARTEYVIYGKGYTMQKGRWDEYAVIEQNGFSTTEEIQEYLGAVVKHLKANGVEVIIENVGRQKEWISYLRVDLKQFVKK